MSKALPTRSDWQIAADALFLAFPWDMFEDQSCVHIPDDCPPDDPDCEPCEIRRAAELYRKAEENAEKAASS